VAHGPSDRSCVDVIRDDLPFDLSRIGEVLERHCVRYVVVGGMSGTFHGMVDYRTKDVDLLVQETREKPAAPRCCVNGTRCDAARHDRQASAHA
jgi:hypothetical protein